MSRRSLVALAGALVAVVVFTVYSPWNTRTFIRDDHSLVEDEDASYREAPLRALFLKRFWPESAVQEAKVPYYRPLVLASFRVDLSLGGTPTEFHFTNVLLHTLATIMVAACAARFGAGGPAAVSGALLFGLAPRLTESVAWISGRTDVLACLFAMAALASSPDAPVRKASQRGPIVDALLAAVSGFFLLLALLSKEVALAAFLALAALAWTRRAEAPRSAPARLSRLVLGLGMPLLAWLLLRRGALGGARFEMRDLGAWGRLATVLEALFRYGEMIVLPFWPRTLQGVAAVPDLRRAALGGALLVVIVLGIVALARRRGGLRMHPGILAALVLFAGALAPVLHVIPFAAGGNVTCDRFLYVPLAALAIAGAIASRRLRRSLRPAALGAVVVLAVAFGVVTRARAHDYENETRFWLVAIEHGEEGTVGPFNALGTYVWEAGYVDLGCRLLREGLIRAEHTGQETSPGARRVTEAYARCLSRAGRYDEAVKVGEHLVASAPTYARGWLVLGFARLQANDPAGALEAFQRAMTMDPTLKKQAKPLVAAATVSADRKDTFNDPTKVTPESRLEYLVGLGRLHEAEALAFEIVQQPDLALPVREKALRLLVENGDPVLARRAAERLAPSKGLLEVLARRERTRAQVAPLLPRLERLAAP